LAAGSRQPEALALHESCGYEIIKNHGRFRDLSNLAATLETCDRGAEAAGGAG
jgi:hypothetical protein